VQPVTGHGHGSLGRPESSTQTAFRSVEPFLQGALLVWQTDRQTDRPTDSSRYSSVTIGRIYVRSTTMQRNNYDVIIAPADIDPLVHGCPKWHMFNGPWTRLVNTGVSTEHKLEATSTVESEEIWWWSAVDSNCVFWTRAMRQTIQQAGGFLRPDCAPSFECPQFRMPPICDCCTPPSRRFNQNIPSSVVLLQQCHCRNIHRGKLQNLSPPSVLFESSPIFLQYTVDTDAKTVDQKFEIRILWFLRYWNFQKGVARSLCGRSGPLWSRPN